MYFNLCPQKLELTYDDSFSKIYEVLKQHIATPETVTSLNLNIPPNKRATLRGWYFGAAKLQISFKKSNCFVFFCPKSLKISCYGEKNLILYYIMY